MLRKILAAMFAAGLLALAGPGQGEAWPSRPMTWLVPFVAGGPGDAVVRILAPRLAEVLGQTVIIENMGGAGGMTALNRIAKAPPDGYLFGTGNSGTHTFNQILTNTPPYNASTDFTPVSMITDGGYVLVARKDLPVRTLPEFIAYAKANQARMQYGSAGFGSGTHVVCALLSKTIGIDITHVPYRGTNLAMQDMIGGRIDYLCDAIATARSQIDGKTVNAIALLWLERSPVLPDVPTANEQGLKDFSESSWNGVFMPEGVPDPIVQRLNAALATTLDTPATRRQLQQLGLNPAPPARRGPEFLGKFVAAEIPKWTAILKSIGIAAQK